MATQRTSASQGWLRRTASQLWRDYVYVMPGFFISLFAFVVLTTLFLVGASTVIIWVGMLMLPLTLTLAGSFADLSRVRLRLLGLDFEPVQYRPREPGVFGYVKTLADGRRWLDLVFEGRLCCKDWRQSEVGCRSAPIRRLLRNGG